MLVIAIITYGCSKYVIDPPLGKVTRIEIRNTGDHLIKSITDPIQISAITKFVDSRREKWTKPFPDTPIPVIVAEFYDDNHFDGHFGIGRTFFETQCGDDFCSQHASANEIGDYLRLIGENEEILNRR